MSFWQTLKPDPKKLPSDIVAGFATGLFSIPEGMAYAKLAGVNPVYGLYSGMISTIVAAMTTGTILMISTLTSAIAISTASVLEVSGTTASQMPAALFTLTFLVGVTMFIMGLARLGSLVNYVSNAVMTGFVAAASLLIIIGELGDLTGYEPSGANKLAQVADWLANIPNWDPATTAVSFATILLMILLSRIRRTEKSAAIITLFLGSIIVNLLDPPTVALVGNIATIPSGLPAPSPPDFSLVPQLALGSISVALVALVQGAGISTAMPNPDGSRSDQSRDFIGEGLGNIAGGFFQALATGGSLSRTGISVGAGTKSRWGGIFAGLWLTLIVILFAPMAEKVPLAVIAGMLFVIGIKLILARVPDAKLVTGSSWGSVAAGTLTFVSALFIPLQWTIFLGAGLSLILYIAASSRHAKLKLLVKNEDGRWEEYAAPETFPSQDVSVIYFAGFDFFAEVPVLAAQMPSVVDLTSAIIILRLRGLEMVPSTGLKWLKRFQEELQAGDNELMLAGVEPHVMEIFRKTKIDKLIDAENIFPAQPGHGAALDKAWSTAHERLAAREREQKSAS
ncbi:MAG: SulP family inorganic anion transporter [Candidatus Promineifilaceae bacterium]|nr:SulP family inorganic anion transporter [Candidatus Promineifilaceae bacterium]